jgi:predicted RNase H-like nuclease (RuvC/YqgF family)
MTIAGKGGRPRRWRSDADRVRAYRARQRGEPEPPQVTQISDEGDQLAAAWQEVQRLGHIIEELRHGERSLRAELARARRDLDAERSYAAHLLETNQSLQERVATGNDERDRLQRELARGATTLVPLPTPPNRAERRRAARDLRRRN